LEAAEAAALWMMIWADADADTDAFGPLGAYETSRPPTPARSTAAPRVTARPAPAAPGRAAPGAAARAAQAAAATCAPGPARLCLSGGRFAVTASWRDFQGGTGRGTAVQLTGDTGYFWFFDPANVEVITKVIDGRLLNGNFWVFYGALSTVEYTLTVTDTATGASKTYTNTSGNLASVGDTGAF
jgi:hypothetical protein